jgi:hypothetical protein
MKGPLGLLSMIAAAAFSAAVAAPAATAGNEIVKCVDAGGQVTLTDQPCEAGTATVRIRNETTPSASVERHVLPAAQLRHEAWKRPPVVRATPLSRDVATLKAARRMMMLQETRPRLAGLN